MLVSVIRKSTLVRSNSSHRTSRADGSILTLLPEERELCSADNDLLILTTNGLWYRDDTPGDKRIEAVMLEDLCQCSIRYTEIRLFLALVFLPQRLRFYA